MSEHIIQFGPIAVAQALTSVFGEEIAKEAARKTPLHTDPEWKELEYQISNASKRALSDVERRAGELQRRRSALEDELIEIDREMANLEPILARFAGEAK